MELSEITYLLPTQQLRERCSELTHRLVGEKPIASDIVKDFYLNLEQQEGRVPDQAAMEAIKFHRFFYETRISPSDLGKIEWYYDPAPNHISYYLTEGGNDKSLLSVASRYIAGEHLGKNIETWEQDKVKSMLNMINFGKEFPNVILSKRPKGMRPNGKIHIIDGVHRLLVVAVHYLQTEGKSPVLQKAFIA